MTPVDEERARIAALIRIAAGAEMLGAAIDVMAAIQSGISAADALTIVWAELSFQIASPLPVDTLEELITSITGKPLV